MHFQRLKTFSECFEMILKRYWTFLSSIGEHCQRFQMHWECSPMHFNVSNWVSIKKGSTLFSLSSLFPNRVTYYCCRHKNSFQVDLNDGALQKKNHSSSHTNGIESGRHLFPWESGWARRPGLTRSSCTALKSLETRRSFGANFSRNTRRAYRSLRSNSSIDSIFSLKNAPNLKAVLLTICTIKQNLKKICFEPFCLVNLRGSGIWGYILFPKFKSMFMYETL